MTGNQDDSLKVAEASVLEGDWTSALTAAGLEEADRIDAGKLCSLAIKFSRISKYDIAEKCYLKALEIDPGNGRTLLFLGNNQFNAGAIEAALSSYEQALRLFKVAPASLYHAYGRALSRLGESHRALSMHTKAFDLEPTNWFFAYTLGSLHESLDHLNEAQHYFTQAFHLKPDVPYPYLSLGRVLEKQHSYDDALAILMKAKQSLPDNLSIRHALVSLCLRTGWLSLGLSELLDWPERQPLPQSLVDQSVDAFLAIDDSTAALSLLTEALRRAPDSVFCLAKHARTLSLCGNWEEAYNFFSQVVSLDMYQPIAFYKNFALVCEQLGIIKTRACWPDLVPCEILREQEHLGDIWHILNERPLPDADRLDRSQDIDQTRADLFFARYCDFRVLDLSALDQVSQKLLAESGIVVSHLLSNRDNQLSEAGVCGPRGEHPLNVEDCEHADEAWSRADSHFFFKQQAIAEGVMRVVCPFSGDMLCSDRSFLTDAAVFYRFESHEVFYLACGLRKMDKSFFYFPKTDIVVDIHCGDFLKLDLNEICRLQAFLVTYGQDVVRYLITNKSPETVAVIGPQETPGYHLWNDLSSLYALENSNILGELDRLLVLTSEYFGPIEEFFKDLSRVRIERDRHPDPAVRALVENWFLVPLCHMFVPEELLQRIRTVCHEKSTPEMRSEICAAKKHFPLLFVNVRVHNRLWLEETEGLSSLLNALFDEYPDLAVIVDGHSSYIRHDGSSGETTTGSVIAEKRHFEQISKLLNPHLPVCNKIGAMIHESIAWAEASDCYLVHWGTAALKPQLIAGKPGISYGVPEFFVERFAVRNWAWLFRENGVEGPIVFGDNHIMTPTKKDIFSFSLDWRVLYEEIKRVIYCLPRRMQ